MGLFRSKEEKELDALILKIDMNMSNNYKDAAQADFRKFSDTLDAMLSSGVLKPAVSEKYEHIRDSYAQKLQGYTHKDQKPYWH